MEATVDGTLSPIDAAKLLPGQSTASVASRSAKKLRPQLATQEQARAQLATRLLRFLLRTLLLLLLFILGELRVFRGTRQAVQPGYASSSRRRKTVVW